MKIKTSQKAGFTLVEIMIVVAIIGLLAAIAIPNFVKARRTSQTNACINNLRQLDGAKAQWALETGGSGPLGNAEITPYLGRGVNGSLANMYCPTMPAPHAPMQGYVLGAVDVAPSCGQFDAVLHNAVLQ